MSHIVSGDPSTLRDAGRRVFVVKEHAATLAEKSKYQEHHELTEVLNSVSEEIKLQFIT